MKASSLVMGLIVGGVLLISLFGLLSDNASAYGIDVEDRYSGVYEKIENVTDNFGAAQQEKITQGELASVTGYFSALDIIWEIVKSPFTVIGIIAGNEGILEALMEDVDWPGWFNLPMVLLALLTISFVFLIVSAILKYKM